MFSQAVRTENARLLFETFKTAVLEERKAQRLYAHALSLCTDEFLRPIFQELIDDEKRHERLLIERYNAMATQMRYEPAPADVQA